MSTFTARYPGRCGDCGERIEPGQRVVYTATYRGDDQVVHADCDDGGLGPMPEPRTVTVCKLCNLVQPCDCD